MRRIMNTFRRDSRRDGRDTQAAPNTQQTLAQAVQQLQAASIRQNPPPQHTQAYQAAAARAPEPAAQQTQQRPSMPRANAATRERQTNLQQQTPRRDDLTTWCRQGSVGEDRLEAVQRIRQCLANNEPTLCLSHLGLRSLPASIGQLAQLKTLMIDHNQLSELPESVGDLAQLNCLQADHNRLASLPDAVQALSQLRTLRVAHNQLRLLPAGVGRLPKLLDLSVQHNPLGVLPPEVLTLRAGTVANCNNHAFASDYLATLQQTVQSHDYRGPVIYTSPAVPSHQDQRGADSFAALNPAQKIQALLEFSANCSDGRLTQSRNFRLGSRDMTQKECLLLALELALLHHKPLIPAISLRLLTDLPNDTQQFLILGVNFRRDRLVAWSKDQGLPVEAGAARTVVDTKDILKPEINPQNVHDSDVSGHFQEQFKLIAARVEQSVSLADAQAGITALINPSGSTNLGGRAATAIDGLHRVMARTDAARSFALSPAQTLALVWTYIESTDPAQKILLHDALENRLVEIGNSSICTMGLTERLIDIPTAVDWSVTHGISQEHLNIEIASMAGDINEEYEALFGADADELRANAQASGNPQQVGDLEERINTIKRDMFIAKAKVELVLLRNLDEAFVNGQIGNIFPSGEAMRQQM